MSLMRLQSSQGSSGVGSASKLTHEAVGKPQFFAMWASPQGCLTTGPLDSLRESVQDGSFYKGPNLISGSTI